MKGGCNFCMVLSFTACTDKKSKTPEMTLQDIYDANNVAALLKSHDSVHVLRTKKA